MKKMIVVMFLSLLIMPVLLTGCGGKYSDVNKANEEYITLVSDYIDAIDRADNATDIVTAINRFSDGMEDLGPRMKTVYEKYPELKDGTNPPEELKETTKRVEEMAQKMFGAAMKLMPYMMNQEVMQAQQRLSESMMQIE